MLSRALSGGKIIGGVSLDLEGVGDVVNFSDEEVRGEELPASPKAKMLTALGDLARTLGIVRGAEDYLLVSEGSLLSGDIKLGELLVRSALGERAVSPEEVVGILGGAGARESCESVSSGWQGLGGRSGRGAANFGGRWRVDDIGCSR